MSLHELLSKPFGPYVDTAILDERCKSVPREMVSISSLWLDCNGAPIGFDETEVSVPHTARSAAHPIRFYGIVEIKSLSWVSQQGRKWLEIDVQKRDIEKRMHPEINCFILVFKIASTTGCKLNIKRGVTYFDTRQNQTIAGEFANIIGERFGMVASYTRVAASTDFGNVTYEVPGFHPHFAIPTVPRGGNHTPEFAVAARTQGAHDATMVVTKGLSLTGFRVLNDNHFFKKVKDEFDATKGSEGWMGAKNTMNQR